MIGYGLLWLESLAAALLFQATVTAVAARWGRWLRRVVPVLVAVGLIAAAATLSVAIWTAYREAFRFEFEYDPAYNIAGLNNSIEGAVPASMVIQICAWTIALVFGSGWILWRGWRRGAETAPNVAASWPRDRLAIAWLVALALTGITFSNMDQAVKAQLSSARADAGLIALSHAPPRPPDRENAALVYRRAFEVLKPLRPYSKGDGGKADPWWLANDKLDAKNKDLIEYLRQRQPGLSLVPQAAAMSACSFDYNYYVDPYDLLLPETTYLRMAANDLAMDALVKATSGNAHAALEDVAAMYGIADHVDVPFFVGLLQSVAVEKHAIRVLEEVLALSTPDPQDLAFVRLDPSPTYQMRLHRDLQLEEAGGLSAFGMLGNENANGLIYCKWYDGSPWLPVPMPLYRVFFLADDLASYRGVMKRYQFMTIDHPHSEMPPQWWDQEAEVLEGAPAGMVARLLIPAAINMRKSALRGDARRRLAQVAVALTDYRAKKGAYPEQLDALVPDYLPHVPRDPFDGKPLRFKSDDKGVVVYSVGPDLNDDISFRLKP